MKYLVSNYMGLLWAVYSGTVQEVGWAQDLIYIRRLGGVGTWGFYYYMF